jgi:hypothetical protein
MPPLCLLMFLTASADKTAAAKFNFELLNSANSFTLAPLGFGQIRYGFVEAFSLFLLRILVFLSNNNSNRLTEI